MTETQTLQKLALTYSPGRAMNIYDEFIARYKQKHIGDVLFSTAPEDSKKWYDKRAAIFQRYASINYKVK